MGKIEAPKWRAVTRVGIVLGLMLVVASFIVKDVRALDFVETDFISLGLLVAGAVLALGGAVVNYRMFVSFFSGRRTVEGANFAAVVLLAVVLAGLLCFITTRWFVRMDWTGKREYALHSKTLNILRSLDQDVRITVLYTFSGDPMDPQLAALWLDKTTKMLQEFRAASPRVTVEELDWSGPDMRTRAEDLLRRIGEDNIPGRAVVFEGLDGHQIVERNQSIEVLPTGGAMFTGEDAYAAALTKLTEKEKATIYALTGHGERPLEAKEPEPNPYGPPQPSPGDMASDPRLSLSRFVRELEKDHYEVKPLSLAVEGSVPDDCAVLLVVGPRAPLADREIEAIRRYLDGRDGRAIFLADTNALPGVDSNLAELLAPYGIRLRNDAVGIWVLQDIFGRLFRVPVPVSPNGMADHPVTAGLSTFSLEFDKPVPIEIENITQPGPIAKPLLTAIDQAWGETDIDLSSEITEVPEYAPGVDTAKPLILGAVVEPGLPPGQPPMPGANPEDLPGPRLVVLGSSEMTINDVVSGKPGHLYFLQNCVNWMAGRAHMLGIPPKSMDFSKVPVSQGRVRAAKHLFTWVLPACVVLLGIAVLIVRRR